MSLRRLILPVWVLAAAGAQAAPQVYQKEPPNGALRYGEIILVDDGSCPKGQIKQVMGGHIASKRNLSAAPTRRERKCVAR
jgi:hypothetical protein